MEEKVGAIIVAAGISQRMGKVDKIMVPLGGKPLLAYSVDVFQDCSLIHQIVIVLSKENLGKGKELLQRQKWTKAEVCLGGPRRQDSVVQGLKRLRDCRVVVIHDGARPHLTSDLIETGLREVKETGAAIAAVPVTDTVKVVHSGIIRETLSRTNLWLAQTPQVFYYDLIWEAHQQIKGEMSDDASLVEALGYKVRLYMGSYLNIKVTTPEDLALAEAILVNRK